MNLDQSAAVKITTALYYTPSGRCIHKERGGRPGGYPGSVAIGGRVLPLERILREVERAKGTLAAEEALTDAFGLSHLEATSLLGMTLKELVAAGLREASEDSVQEKKTTAGGRVVYGGGGIAPDIAVEPEIPPFAMALERRRLLFSFAVHYAAVQRSIGPDFEADDAVIREFREYISDAPTRFEYAVPGEMELEQLEKALDGGEYNTEKLLSEMGPDLAEAFREREERDFQESLGYVRGAIKREIASRMWGTEARIRASFEIDRQLRRAVALLRDSEEYDRRIHGSDEEEGLELTQEMEMGAP